VVWASSETLLGLPFETPPPYLPVDEEYPARPETSYSLAKHLDEQMAAQFRRWNPQLKMIGLRFSNVMEPADYAASRRSTPIHCCGSGTPGRTSTPATARKRCDWPSSTRRRAWRCSSSPTRTPS
jgi:nucleoside-diphosphate-sugar epimerase